MILDYATGFKEGTNKNIFLEQPARVKNNQKNHFPYFQLGK